MGSRIERVTLVLFACYVALIPGSSVLVALDRVPQWGLGFGSALLLLQGASMLAWLVWRYGVRGLTAGLLVAALGFFVEYIGETTGIPFGRYSYTDLVQPKLLGVVPLAICAAWMMSAASAYEIARLLVGKWGTNIVLLLTATLVLLLDLQIETVAALINRYWIWVDSGPYYGVPTANFIAWWLMGLAMALVLRVVLEPGARGRGSGAEAKRRQGEAETRRSGDKKVFYLTLLLSSFFLRQTLLSAGYRSCCTCFPRACSR